jgi:hypothetical protein
MKKPTKTESEARGNCDILTDIFRKGAQKLIAPALEVEIAEVVAA